MSERGSIGTSFAVCVLVLLGITITCMFAFNNTAKKAENATEEAVVAETENYGTTIGNTSTLTESDFNKFYQSITTNNPYDVSLEVHMPGENAGKKTSQVSHDKIGENTKTIYTMTQIREKWKNNNGIFPLPKGSQVYIKVKDINRTSETSSTSKDITKTIAETTVTCTKETNNK